MGKGRRVCAPATRADVVDMVCRIAGETLCIPNGLKITGESDLVADLGMDELDKVELVMELEERFGVTVLEEEVDGVEKLGGLADVVARRLGLEVGAR